MKEKVNVKAVVSLVWLFIGIAAIVVGLLLKAGDIATKVLGVTMSSSSNTAIATAIFESSKYGAMLTLKYIIVASGVIIAAISSIGFAGAIQAEKLEDLMYDDIDYDLEDAECDFDCASCNADCEYTEDEVQEFAEETAEEAVEEVAEETAEEIVEETTEQ